MSGGDVQASSASVRLGGDGSQQGDTSIGNAAGRDVYQGLSGEQLKALMQQQSEFYLTLVSAYERQVETTGRQLQRLRDENDMWRAGEQAAREARQKALDRRLRHIEWTIGALALLLLTLAWRLWPAITAVVAMAARH